MDGERAAILYSTNRSRRVPSVSTCTRQMDRSEGSVEDVDIRSIITLLHTFVSKISVGAEASLEYFSEQFGAYLDRPIRSSNFRVRRLRHRARAPVGFSEDYFMAVCRKARLTCPLRDGTRDRAPVVGRHAAGAMVQGHGFLSESLANYSAMILMDKNRTRRCATCLRLPDGSIHPGSRGTGARSAGVIRGGPAVHKLSEGCACAVHDARAYR